MVYVYCFSILPDKKYKVAPLSPSPTRETYSQAKKKLCCTSIFCYVVVLGDAPRPIDYRGPPKTPQLLKNKRKPSHHCPISAFSLVSFNFSICEKFIIETYAKNVLAICINGHPKFPRLMEGPDQRIPTLMPAASMGVQKFPISKADRGA